MHVLNHATCHQTPENFKIARFVFSQVKIRTSRVDNNWKIAIMKIPTCEFLHFQIWITNFAAQNHTFASSHVDSSFFTFCRPEFWHLKRKRHIFVTTLFSEAFFSRIWMKSSSQETYITTHEDKTWRVKSCRIASAHVKIHILTPFSYVGWHFLQ